MGRIFRKHEDGYEALPAVVVADKTDKLGKRLAQLGIGLMILFFVVNSYIQSSKNGALLERGDKQRGQLVESLDRQTRTLDQQTELIKRLQQAIREQNRVLRVAGLPVSPIPGFDDGTPSATASPSPSTRPRATPRPQPNATANPKPAPRPSPKPSPSPRPQDPVTQPICDLTGICL